MSDMQTSRYDAEGPGGRSVTGAGHPEPDAWWMSSSQQVDAPPPPPPGAPSAPPPYSAPHAAPYGVPPLAGAPGRHPDHTSPLPLAPTPPGPPTQRSSNWRNRFLAAAVLVAVAIGGGATGAALEHHDAPVTSAATAPVTGGTAPTQPLAKVAAAVQPSVVSIQVSGNGESGEGSGVILRSDGTILTNNHVAAVAADGGSITVRFSDGKTAPARIVGRDPSTDLAVIRAENVSGLRPAALGSSNDLHVGDTVLALGSPLGLEGSVSSGIVSALHRTVNLGGAEQDNPSGGPAAPSAVVTDAVQTDAAINPGNSGGPLVDSSGRVVGINTAIASLGGGSATSTQSGNIGVGFAIPIDQAKAIADQLSNGQKPTHAQLGVAVSDATNGTSQ